MKTKGGRLGLRRAAAIKTRQVESTWRIFDGNNLHKELTAGQSRSISRVLFRLPGQAAMIIPLGHTLPHASSDLTRRHRTSNPYPTFPHPWCPTSQKPRHRLPIWSCSGWGLPSSRCHHRDWCALTAPFHPYQNTQYSGMPFHTGIWRSVFCGTFLRVAPTGRYPAPCSTEPGLSSPCRDGKARSSNLLCPILR